MKPRAGQISYDNGTSGLAADEVQAALDEIAAGGGYTDEQVRDVISAALVAGSGVTITPDDPGDTITIAATSGELLMQDGVSSPPVPLETEDGTDWLYEG